jgi:hypothetical protein
MAYRSGFSQQALGAGSARDSRIQLICGPVGAGLAAGAQFGPVSPGGNPSGAGEPQAPLRICPRSARGHMACRETDRGARPVIASPLLLPAVSMEPPRWVLNFLARVDPGYQPRSRRRATSTSRTETVASRPSANAATAMISAPRA